MQDREQNGGELVGVVAVIVLAVELKAAVDLMDAVVMSVVDHVGKPRFGMFTGSERGKHTTAGLGESRLVSHSAASPRGEQRP